MSAPSNSPNTATAATESGSIRKIAVLIAVLVAFFIVLTCFYQVRRTQAAVITTFEKPVGIVTDTGLHFKLPWPIQKTYLFDLRTRIYQSPYNEYLLKDGNVIVRSFVCWAIENVETYKNKVGVTVSDGENIVAKLLAKHLRSILSDQSLSALIRIDPQGQENPFVKVEKEILAQVQTEAKKDYGIAVSMIGFDRFELPEETTRDVFERMKSERMKMVEKIMSEGKYKADRIRKEAEAEKTRMEAEADAEAIRIRGKADTEAFEHQSVYSQNPQFALFLKKLQALEKTTEKKTTIVIDGSTPPFDMLSNPNDLLGPAIPQGPTKEKAETKQPGTESRPSQQKEPEIRK